MKGAGDPLAPGTRFGVYRIEQRLGAGGVGAVYRATHLGLQKPVVLKVLHPQHARLPNVRARFAREGRAAAAIRHPHVVDVTDVGEHEGTPYLIMELLEGESLSDLIDRIGPLPPHLAADLLVPVIAAVDAAHAAGVVHRDLKPDNLFITCGAAGEPFPKVLDFGISRVIAGDGENHTATATVLGTPAYMSPEQIENPRGADARSDQYALGVILYECLTAADAFSGANVYAILKRVGDGRFKSPREHRPELPAALEAIVLTAMSKSPAARFPSLSAMAAALLPFASDRTRVAWSTTFSPDGQRRRTDAPFAMLSAPPPAPDHADTFPEAPRTDDARPPPVAPARRRSAWALGAALVAVAVLAVGLRASRTRGAPTTRPLPPVAGPLPSERPAAQRPEDAPVVPLRAAASPPAASQPPPAPPPRPPRGRRPHVRARPPENGAAPAPPSFPDLPP